MKPTVILLSALMSLLLPLAAQAAEVNYTAKFKGIDCNGCKTTISRSLGKIKGVKTIRIVKDGDNQHRATITTDGTKEISKSEAAAALGTGNHFTLVSWSKG